MDSKYLQEVKSVIERLLSGPFFNWLRDGLINKIFEDLQLLENNINGNLIGKRKPLVCRGLSLVLQ